MNIELNPSQSLALRRAIDALKTHDSLYTACPDVVRAALCDILMPPYSSAEQQVTALEKANADSLQLLEKFGAKIRELEKQLTRR